MNIDEHYHCKMPAGPPPGIIILLYILSCAACSDFYSPAEQRGVLEVLGVLGVLIFALD